MENGVKRRLVAAQSFSEEEVSVLHEIMKTLLRGGDARMFARSQAGQKLARKAQGMRESIERQKAGKE